MYTSAKIIVVSSNILTKNKHTVLEIQFRSVQCTTATRIRKSFEQLFISIQAAQGDYGEQLLTNHFKKVFKPIYTVYTYSICMIHQ